MWCCPVVEVGLKTKHKILIAPTKASVKCVTAYIRLWLVILWLWWVMLLIWLLLRSLVGYSCACGLLMWLCCCAIGDIHSGVKSGCKLVTLLSFLWYDKLWGPSQRVVTLLHSGIKKIFSNIIQQKVVNDHLGWPFYQQLSRCGWAQKERRGWKITGTTFYRPGVVLRIYILFIAQNLF